MARANLNKSVWLVINTTTASKYTPRRTRISIHWNPPFQTQIYLVKVPLSVNIVKQDLLHKKQFLKILWSEFWKGGFQLMLILVLLGMYFDAVVVFVTSQTLLYRLALAILWCRFAQTALKPDLTSSPKQVTGAKSLLLKYIYRDLCRRGCCWPQPLFICLTEDSSTPQSGQATKCNLKKKIRNQKYVSKYL